MSKKKIALITNVPAAYRLDFYETLSQESDIEFKVFFYGLGSNKNKNFHCHADLSDRIINYELTNSFIFHQRNRELFIPFGILPQLARFKPNLIISIGNLLPASLAWFYSKMYRIPILFWWGGIPFSAVNQSFFKKILRRLFFRQTNGIIAYCQQAKTDLRTLGYPEDKILVLGNATFDVTQYTKTVNRYRTQLSLQTKIVLLAVGQLTERKNYIFLLEVFEQLIIQYSNLHLLIIGEGNQKQALEHFCHQQHLQNVQFLGYIPNNQLPQYYAQADIFLHPSLQDQWPQVLNEAMAAHLPIVVSNCCGIEDELVYNQVNGYILPLCHQEWVQAIKQLITDRSLRDSMRLKSQEIISQFSMGMVNQRFLDFVLSQF